MHRPAKSGQPNRGPDLVRAYIEFVGSQEPDNRHAIDKLKPTDLRHASLLIGRSCLVFADGNDKAADRMLRRARRNMEPVMQSKYGSMESVASRLYHLATLLEERDSPEAASNYRQASYAMEVRDIGRNFSLTRQAKRSGKSRQSAAGTIGRHRGNASESRITALLGRRDPSLSLTTPALLHWNNGHRHRSNYDLLFVNGDRNPSGKPLSYKAQIKHPCMGYCETTTARDTQYGLRKRSGYTEDIVFISDHCDTGRAHASQRREDGMGLNRLLYMEQRGDAAPEQISALDIVTEGLVLVTTSDDPLRHGTLPAESVPPYQIFKR